MTGGRQERRPPGFDRAVQAVALLGGALLVALATMVTISVTLRSDLDPENVATTLFAGDAGVADTTQSSRRFAVRYQTFD